MNPSSRQGNPVPDLPLFADRPITTESLALPLQRVAFKSRLGESMRGSLKVNVHDDQSWLHGLVAEIEGYVLTQQLFTGTFTVQIARDVKHEVWATWWDHFKSEQVEATSPLWRWVARRWPPKKVTITRQMVFSEEMVRERRALFPEAQIPLPAEHARLGRPVIFETVSRRGW